MLEVELLREISDSISMIIFNQDIKNISELSKVSDCKIIIELNLKTVNSCKLTTTNYKKIQFEVSNSVDFLSFKFSTIILS